MTNRTFILISRWVSIGCISLLFLIFLLYALGARINTSRSIPVGLYWITDSPVKKGAYVLFCPPVSSVFDDAKIRGYIGAGFCPGGDYGYMMKRVLAEKNDVIYITDEGVRVNSILLPNSVPLRADRSGQQLPHYRRDSYVLESYEVLLMSDGSATSFDGRYFGPLNRSQIKAVIRPIFTW